jgi:DNA-binding LytR/AlgR family response regulator
MTTALIADDEAHLRTDLRETLAEVWPELAIAAEAANGVEAARLIDELQPDIAFLDIKMPGLTGLEVAQSIQAKTRVVFVTAFDQFAVSAFEANAVDYLLKPVAAPRLKASVDKLKAALSAPDDAAQAQLIKLLAQWRPVADAPKRLRFIRASKGEVTYQIELAEVLFFQSDDKYTVVQTANGEHLIRMTLTELVAQLDPEQFLQIHRSTVVNQNYVMSTRRDAMGHMQLHLKGHAKALAVARPYQSLFKQM